jgi:hypothetical protein
LLGFMSFFEFGMARVEKLNTLPFMAQLKSPALVKRQNSFAIPKNVLMSRIRYETN